MPTINRPKPKPSDRKKQRQSLYNNKQWKALSQYMRMENPICQRCNDAITEDVHHILSPFEYGLSHAEAMRRLLDPDNLICLCRNCHNILHGNIKKDN